MDTTIIKSLGIHISHRPLINLGIILRVQEPQENEELALSPIW